MCVLRLFSQRPKNPRVASCKKMETGPTDVHRRGFGRSTIGNLLQGSGVLRRSFASQGLHRVDANGAKRRQVASQQRHREEQWRNEGKGEGVNRRDAKE